MVNSGLMSSRGSRAPSWRFVPVRGFGLMHDGRHQWKYVWKDSKGNTVSLRLLRARQQFWVKYTCVNESLNKKSSTDWKLYWIWNYCNWSSGVSRWLIVHSHCLKITVISLDAKQIINVYFKTRAQGRAKWSQAKHHTTQRNVLLYSLCSIFKMLNNMPRYWPILFCWPLAPPAASTTSIEKDYPR